MVELMQFLMGYNPQYDPDGDREKYTIDFVDCALKFYGLEKFMPEFIDVLVFDCIIGNQDRHQENWGFIIPADTKQKLQEHVDGPQDFWRESTVAPIYDSGKSMFVYDIVPTSEKDMLKTQTESFYKTELKLFEINK